MPARSLALAWSLLASIGCTRANEGAAVTPDPAYEPLPPAPSVAPSPTPKPVEIRTCEPTVSCGVWGECTFLESLADGTFRALDPAYKGARYRRRRDCWPADAGLSGCTQYCTGPGLGPPCVDGLHPEDEVCTGAAIPRPSPHRCIVVDDRCVKAP